MQRVRVLPVLLSLFMFSACGAEPVEEQPECGAQSNTRCSVDNWPMWSLKDIHPASARHNQTYGLKAFEGKTVVVSFLVGWCPYCRAQSVKLQKMQDEFIANNQDVQIVVLHGESASNTKDQQALIYILDEEGNITKDEKGEPVYRHKLPMFQDTEDVDAWGQHEGGKDDFYIYRPDGTLSAYFPSGAGLNLADEAQYKRLKDTILDANQ